jgi:hypothetical protein
MSGVDRPERAVGARPLATPPEVPDDYGDAYQRAYRQSLAAHATELMSPARPGKRAAEPVNRTRARVRLESWVIDTVASPSRRRLAGAGLALVLVLLAYAAGRLAA